MPPWWKTQFPVLRPEGEVALGWCWGSTVRGLKIAESWRGLGDSQLQKLYRGTFHRGFHVAILRSLSSARVYQIVVRNWLGGAWPLKAVPLHRSKAGALSRLTFYDS